MALNLSDLDGTNGFRLDGADAGDLSGASVAGAGDVNGDGFDDLIVGAPTDANGETYVVFGTDAGFAASLDLSALDGSNGFRLEGIETSLSIGGSHISVAGAGDVNGDGIDDLIVGARGADPDGKSDAGASYVVFGTDTGFAASLDLAALDGSNGFQLNGIDPYDYSGSVAGAGDVNGDGIDDVIVGASGAGESYVVFGTATGFAASLDLAALDGSNGFALLGSNSSVAGAGDVNGDGVDDLIIGNDVADADGNELAGESYVVFGTDAGFAATLDLAGLDGSNGFRLDGIDAFDHSGYPVAGAGDVNGDGFDDLIIGALGADPAGETYIVFGTDTGFAPSVDLSALDGTNGFRLNGIDAYGYGFTSVAGAGDVNGDGFDDLIIGDTGSGEGGQGACYVVFGSGAGFAASLDLAALDGSNGFRLNGSYSTAGDSVAGAGDVNGDGFDDLIVGAFNANPDGKSIAGSSYVIFGSTLLGGANDAPLASADTIDVGTFDRVDLAADNGNGIDRDPDFDDLSIVAIDGIAVAPGGTVTLASGLRVTLVGDTEVRFDAPNLVLGTRISDSFDYEVSDGRSGSDTATVTVDFTQDAIALADLDGTNGFRLEGIETFDISGVSVAGAGDVNGDGIDDLIVGAKGADPDGKYDAGESYVIFGTNAGFAASLDISALDGSNGFRLNGIDAYDLSGFSVAGAGDVDGDGIDDLILGAYDADPGGRDDAGESYVVFGTETGFAASLDLSALDGSNGFRLDGIDAGDYSGRSVAGAGDVNGDGFDDLIVGAPFAFADGKEIAGESYVVFGTDAGFAASLDLSSLDGSNGFRLDGIDAGDRSGFSVAGAGDVNGDGFDDLIIGATAGPPGESYVVFGTDAGFAASLDLSALDGTNGFRLNGTDDAFGFTSVAVAGDVNGDGFDDLIVGDRDAGPLGDSYVVFGTDAGFAANLDLSALDGSNGFRLEGVGNNDYGGSVAGAGDVNGDGFDDLIVGAHYAGLAGETYVVFGTDTGFAASLDLSALDGSNGFRLDGIDPGDHSGWSVAGAGDVNADGFDDLIVGAPDANDDAGQSYVVFGFDTGGPLTPIFGGPCRDVLVGTDASESFHPGGGRDFVTTGGGEDTIFFDDRAGKRDVLTIADFDLLADTLDLRGAAVAETFECATKTVLLLEGPDCDTVVLLGLSDSPLDLI